MCVVRITVTKNKLYWCHGYLLVQNTDQIQNVDCRLQSGYEMQNENLKSFFVRYVITCHLTTHQVSHNHFSAISLHNYLHYCGIFLAHFKTNLNIILSLYIVFSLNLRASWLVWRLQILPTRNNWQLCTWSVLSPFWAVCVYCVDKNVDRDQNCSLDLYFWH